MNDNYIIVEKTSLESLTSEVNRKIQEGYVPCGSVLATKFSVGQPTMFAQPMIMKSLT